MDRNDDDRVPANEHDLAGTVFKHGDAAQMAGDGSDHHPVHRPGAVSGKGFEGERSIPSPAPMYAHWVGWLVVPMSQPFAEECRRTSRRGANAGRCRG